MIILVPEQAPVPPAPPMSKNARRRLLVAVLIFLSILTACVAVPVVGAVAWLARITVDAGKGEACSTCAAGVYLDALQDGHPGDAWRVLGGSHRDELLQQLDQLNAEVGRSAGGRPFEIAPVTAVPMTDKITDPSATLQLRIEVTWQTEGHGTTFNTSLIETPWVFHIVNEGSGGWRIHELRNARWCEPIRCKP